MLNYDWHWYIIINIKVDENIYMELSKTLEQLGHNKIYKVLIDIDILFKWQIKYLNLNDSTQRIFIFGFFNNSPQISPLLCT